MDVVHTVDELFDRFLEHHNENDLGAVFDLAAPELTAMARHGRLDTAGCEDALQETFLTILRRSHTFRAGRRFMPWAQGIMARQIKVERRRQARRLRALRLDASDVNEDLARGPRQVLEDSELRQQIEDAVAGLSSTHREVVDRALLRGESASDLAEGMGLSANAIAVRLHRGLNQIRKVLPRTAAMGIAGTMATRARGAKSIRSKVTKAARMRGAEAFGAQAWWLSTTALVTAAGLAGVAAGGWFLQRDDGGSGIQPVNASEVVSTPPSSDATGLAAVAGQASNRRGAAGDASPVASLATGKRGAEPTDLAARAMIQVLRPDGRPVGAGAEVFVLQTSPRVILPEEPMVAFAATDQAGRFLAPTAEEAGDATPLLYVRSTRVTPPLAGVLPFDGTAPGEAATPLYLSEALKLEFEVKDEHGEPIEGAQVAALGLVDEFYSAEAQHALDHGMLWPIGYRHLFGAETDAAGRCAIDCFLTRELHGQLLGSAAAWYPGRSSYAESFQIPKGTPGQLSFTLPTTESVNLSGHVVDEAGTPLEGAEVHFSFRGFDDVEDSLACVTRSDGSWALEADDLDWFPIELRFEYEGRATETQAFGNPNDLPPMPMEITMTSATSLRGHVTGVDGRPAPAELTLISMGRRSVAQSDSSGEFVLTDLSADQGVLYAVGARGTATMDVQSFASPIEVILSAAPVAPDVMVHAVDPRSGSPLAIIELALLRQGDETGAWPRITVQDGEGRGTDVPPGKWSAVAMLADERGAVSLDFEVPATEELQRVEIPYTEAGRLGVVIHAGPELDTSTGRALISRVLGPEIPVWARASNEFARNELGLDVYPGITQGTILTMPGTTDIAVEGDGWATRPVRFQVVAGETTRLDLEAIPAGTVRLQGEPMLSPGCLTLEVQPVDREPGAASWFRVASALTADHQPIDHALQLPPGDWRWRLTASAFLDETGVHRADPQATGTMTVVAGETVELQVLGQ